MIKGSRGLIMARPYFRMREGSYLELNASIRSRDRDLKYRDLYKYPINFRFCSFAVENLKKVDLELMGLFTQVKDLRNSIAVDYLPVGLTRAKAFNRGISASYDFSDLVQIANEGILSAIDKYVMEPDGVDFNTMVFGRITGHLINNASNYGSVYIGPSGLKKLYSIKKALLNNPELNSKQVSDIMNIAEQEVVSLLNATSNLSLDQTIEDTKSRFVDQMASDTDVEEELGQFEIKRQIKFCLGDLDMIERKVLVLKGQITYDDYIRSFTDDQDFE
jgi:DNA-directed RNA polymerase specialized sigma subunit